jgi:hypothetical protein
MVSAALARGDSAELTDYQVALTDIYGGYYRLGRLFLRMISKPDLFRLMCQIGMRSETIMAFALQVLANLAEDHGGRMADRAFRGLVKVAERGLEEYKDPEIPVPNGVASRQSALTP